MRKLAILSYIITCIIASGCATTRCYKTDPDEKDYAFCFNMTGGGKREVAHCMAIKGHYLEECGQ